MSTTATKHTHRTNAGDGTRAEALDLAAEINALHGEIAAMARTTLGKTIEIGELLTKQKAALKHGEWLPWCGAIMDSKPNSGPTGFPEDPAGGDGRRDRTGIGSYNLRPPPTQNRTIESI